MSEVKAVARTSDRLEAAYKPLIEGGLTWAELEANLGQVITAFRYTLEEGFWLPTHHDIEPGEELDSFGRKIHRVFRDPAAIMIGRLVGLLPPDQQVSCARVRIASSYGSHIIELPFNTPMAFWSEQPLQQLPNTALKHGDDSIDIGVEAYAFTLTTDADISARQKWLGQAVLATEPQTN